MANKLLGEIEIELGGTKLLLKPEFEGILAMEDTAGCSMTALVNKFVRAQASFKDIFAIIWGGLIGSGQAKDFSQKEIGNMILAHGWTKLFNPCGQFVGAAYSGKPIEEIDASVTEKSEKKKDEPEPSK